MADKDPIINKKMYVTILFGLCFCKQGCLLSREEYVVLTRSVVRTS